ncbi:MAG: hypothetical protein LW716_00305, partial [Microcystis sp. 53602_E8]|nr:hypothetical protein [Microcystis sp. 53602_E8]
AGISLSGWIWNCIGSLRSQTTFADAHSIIRPPATIGHFHRSEGFQRQYSGARSSKNQDIIYLNQKSHFFA